MTRFVHVERNPFSVMFSRASLTVLSGLLGAALLSPGCASAPPATSNSEAPQDPACAATWHERTDAAAAESDSAPERSPGSVMDSSLDELVGYQFGALPGLRQAIQMQLRDPATSPLLRNFLEHALRDPALTIAKLTDEIRNRWNIPASTNSFAEFSPYASFNPFFFYDSARGQSPGQMSDLKLAPGRTGHRYLVMVPNLSPAPTSHDSTSPLGPSSGRSAPEPVTALPDSARNPVVALSCLIHELSHVRFYEFLLRNRERLLQTLPPSRYSVTRRNGVERYWFDQSLFSYLTERYAYEQERRFLMAQPATPDVIEARRHFEGLFIKDDGSRQTSLGFSLPQAVRRSYSRVITDPAMAQLDAQTLSQILRGEARGWGTSRSNRMQISP